MLQVWVKRGGMMKTKPKGYNIRIECHDIIPSRQFRSCDETYGDALTNVLNGHISGKQHLLNLNKPRAVKRTFRINKVNAV
jgi:hypothetical protein